MSGSLTIWLHGQTVKADAGERQNNPATGASAEKATECRVRATAFNCWLFLGCTSLVGKLAEQASRWVALVGMPTSLVLWRNLKID